MLCCPLPAKKAKRPLISSMGGLFLEGCFEYSFFVERVSLDFQHLKEKSAASSRKSLEAAGTGTSDQTSVAKRGRQQIVRRFFS